jgi:hypothetical protein
MNNKINTYIEKYDWCKSIIKYHIEFNTALNASYHNFYHTLTVTENIIELCEVYELKEINIKHLIIAGLFHDFGHSKGKYNDAYNIKIAKFYLSEWLSINKIEGIHKETIEQIIDATQYPYVIKSEDLTIFQMIIRDADLCQLFQSNRIQHVYIGLATELNLTLKQILEGQLHFLENIKPCTIWFAKNFDIEKSNIIREVNLLLECINK